MTCGLTSLPDVSGDGLTYTFTIRDDARWSDGEPVTAHDYVWSWERALSPAMGNLYAYMLFPIVNAEPFAKGELDDFSQVGVKALDDLTLQVTLYEATPYFIQLMDHYSTFAVHRPTIEKFGDATDRFTQWTRVENIVGNGPFILNEWNRPVLELKLFVRVDIQRLVKGVFLLQHSYHRNRMPEIVGSLCLQLRQH